MKPRKYEAEMKEDCFLTKGTKGIATEYYFNGEWVYPMFVMNHVIIEEKYLELIKEVETPNVAEKN